VPADVHWQWLQEKNGKQNQRAANVSSHLPPNDLFADLSGWYAGEEDGVNQRQLRKEKEKICIAMFSPNGM
jgi:hypothetical protein